MPDEHANDSKLGLQPGTTIGKYEIREKLGAGGMSVVYKCYDPMLDRFVAAKQISSHLAEDRQFLERFRQEAQLLAKVGAEQSAIVTIHDLVEDERGLFIVMEYVEGPTLEEVLASPKAPLAPRPAVQLLWRLAAGMAAVHRAEIIHRDLKPSNILVAEGLKPKITDFGVAASLSGQTSMLLGTTKYMAPELFAGGDVDGRTDMYSLGFIIYELLLGREVFNEIFSDVVRDPRIATVRWMKWHGNESVTAPTLHDVNPAIPVELSSIVARMMAKDPAGRYETMDALGQAVKVDLAGVTLAGEAIVADRPGPVFETEQAVEEELAEVEEPGPPLEDLPTAPLPKRSMSNQARLILAVAVAVMAIGVLTVGVIRHNRKMAGQRDTARSLYQKAKKSYDERDYVEARKTFDKISQNFPGVLAAKMASIRSLMCQAYLAIEDRQWDVQSDLRERAEGAVEALQRDTTNRDVVEWIRKTRDDIEQIEEYYFVIRQYEQAMARAIELRDAGKFAQAQVVLKKDIPEVGYQPQRAERLATLIEDIALKKLQEELAELQREAESYVAEGNRAQALHTYRKIQQLLESEASLLLDKAVRKQLIEEMNASRNTLNRTQELEDLDSQITKAHGDGNLRLELELRRKLQSLQPADQNAARIRALEIEILYQQAERLRREGQLVEANDAYVAVLRLDPTHKGAKRALEELNLAAERGRLTQEADQAFRQKQWVRAKEIYEKLLPGQPDAEMSRRVQLCHYKIELTKLDQRRDRALAQKDSIDLELLKDDYAKVGEIYPGAYDSDIRPRIATLARVVDRWELLAEGDEKAAARSFAEAIRIYTQAKSLSVTDAERTEVDNRLLDAEFEQYMYCGERAKERGDLTQARAAFRLADDTVRTDAQRARVNVALEEIQALIDQKEADNAS